MTKKLYVGNLSYATTESNLSELFGAVGEVTSVSLITDRSSGRSKGFAFVEMAEDSIAKSSCCVLTGCSPVQNLSRALRYSLLKTG